MVGGCPQERTRAWAVVKCDGPTAKHAGRRCHAFLSQVSAQNQAVRVGVLMAEGLMNFAVQ